MRIAFYEVSKRREYCFGMSHERSIADLSMDVLHAEQIEISRLRVFKSDIYLFLFLRLALRSFKLHEILYGSLC